MPARIEVVLEKLKMPIVGMGKIDILVDGDHLFSLSLGECASAEVSAGKHGAQAVLNGVVKRTSKELMVSAEENATERIYGRYSRMWGSIKLRRSGISWIRR